MAPALTEPLSPTENLTNSAVAASSIPTTRSSRKLESSIANKSSNSSTTKNLAAKSTIQIREKRNRNGEINNHQTPTSSKRVTRFRENIRRNSLTSHPSINGEHNSELQQIVTTRRTSKVASVAETDSSVKSSINNITKSLDTKNEQMGLSTAPLNSKNKILNNNNNTSQDFVTIDDKTEVSSTAQLLADLTNEAITAEICLRNQLKDVNLVKTSGDSSSPIVPQDTFLHTDTDIAVLKDVSPAIATASEINKTTTAHMEARFNESKSSTNQDTTSSEAEAEETITTKALEEKLDSTKEENDSLRKEETRKNDILVEDNKCIEEDKNEHNKKEKCDETIAKAIYMDTAVAQEPTISAPHSPNEASETKKTVSKLEILSVQELPPVSTDSTMTASEVEDNLEERLSQLDGTAIDSPPPNNHEIGSNEKNSHNTVADATPPHTPTPQQTLSNDLQDLQQQLQQTPPNIVNQEEQSNHLQLDQQQPQTNCFTTPTQSTTSSSTHLLGNNSGTTPQSFIKDSDHVGSVGGAAELEDQDIEEVFKVLKGFEGGTTSDLNVCDLNVLFNEVYMKINETELGGNAVSGGGGSIASGISSNTQSHVTVASPSIQLVKPTEMEEVQMEIGKRQQQMQRKVDFLMRRLRKIQARYMCKHTSEEIAGLFEWTARQACKGITSTAPLQHNESTGAEDPNKCFLKVIAARPPASEWKNIHESLVPANQISTLLRKIESVANAQQLCTTPSASLVNITNKKTKKALFGTQAAAASASASNASAIGSSIFNESKAEEVVVATLDENITDELSQVVGLLQIEMSEVQKAIDSDATESSSGGESADEMVTYNNTHQQTLPITKRAAWRYSRDRAAIASRWSWLLSQISDLEIKIRQHSDLHQEILRSKGPVTCGSEMDTKSTTEEQNNEELMGSCRTRGYLPSLFRKRKLIQTTNIHTISKKAARPSTIKCGCQWPLHPCALCTGRLDPTAPRDLPDTMMISDRIGLLDSSYHPVLSFRENVNNALHFEAIAKQPEWQQRVMRCQAKNIAKNVWRAEREAVAAAAGGHHTSSSKKYTETPPTKRRYIKKKDKLNDEKTASGTPRQHAGSAVNSIVATTTSLSDLGNGTANLSSTTSTTPLVANKGITKGAKKPHCPALRDEILKDSPKSLLPPSFTATTSSSAAATTPNKKHIHQTSDCLPTNNDQFNPSLTPSSLISNNHNHNNSSKSNKHRKLSSSTVVNSHHYNHPNNSSNLYNGDSSYIYSQDYWGGAGENFNVRSRTSSPIHGSSGNVYHKYERSLDRKNRTSYDIDNIVIPYSVAAATRVEVLPYKEIPTPKWRLIDNENEESHKEKISKNHETDIETLLDAKPVVVNGHACDDNKFSESIETISTDSEMKSEKHSCDDNKFSESIETISTDSEMKSEKHSSNNFKTEEDKSNIEKTIKVNAKNLKIDTKTIDPCLSSATTTINNNKVKQIEEKDKKKPHNKENNIKTDASDIDEYIKEPELKKPKIESKGVIDVQNVESENIAEQEFNEEKIALQNVSKLSIEEDEDLSDDAMFLRHERALTEERRKFQTYLKFPWSTRSRANRRIDSRAESSGANTPDPSSPAPQTPSVGGCDLESIPSPLNPATPLNNLDTTSEAGDNSTSFLGINSLPNLSSKRCERRRTTSTKRDREIERRSSTPDSKEIVPPYEPLTFPLTDEQFEELLRAMPSDYGEESKRFDECYLPGGGGGGSIGLGGFPSNKYPRTVSGSTSKRSSRASTLCGDAITTMTGGSSAGGRRVKSSNPKNLRPISADDCNVGDVLLYDDDYDDDYPKHHLTPNDHLTADSVGVRSSTTSDGLYVDDDDDVYCDQYGAYVGRQQRKHRGVSEEDSSEEEPFQDDDPNDPEWRGEPDERLRRKV